MLKEPKGPFRTKNAMAPKTVVFYYRRSVVLCMPICCHFPKDNSIARPFAAASQYGRSDLLSVVFLLWRGPSVSHKPHPSKPTPATYHKRKQKLVCNFRKGALQKLHCNIRFSAVWKPFSPKAALQRAETTLQHWKSCVARKWRFPAAFLRISGSHV